MASAVTRSGLLAARAGGRSGGNIFAATTAMANACGSVNLGQGFPSFATPEFVNECAKDAIGDHNQYTRPGGNPALVEVIGKMYSPLLGREIDPMSQVSVSAGAQEGIFNILATFCDPGEEVVCVEPYFDAYKKAADMAGAKVKGVPLRLPEGSTSAGDFKLDIDELDSTLSDKTKLLILNTPHNPTGKVFDKTELNDVAEVVKRYPDLLVLSDEVYEFMCFDGLKHERFATIEGMWDRTISLFSAGKTFSCTGWRVGYCIGPDHLIQPLIDTQGIVSFCAPSPLQVAVAKALESGQRLGYYEDLARTLERKRDVLCSALRQGGLEPVVPQGGYFVMANTSSLPIQGTDSTARDVAANEWLTKELGVTGIATSNFIRLAYCKTDAELHQASQRITKTKD